MFKLQLMEIQKNIYKIKGKKHLTVIAMVSIIIIVMDSISSTNNKSESTKKIHNIFSRFLRWCDRYKSEDNSGLCENNVILCEK